MPWFYAKSGQQVGPIDDLELDRLIREGAIGSATLVWREGMANWQSLSQLRPGLLPPLVPAAESSIPSPTQVVCTECKKAFPVGEIVQIGSATVCAGCKPIYVQKLREGAVAFNAVASPMRYASFWIRFGAKLVDGLIMMALTMPLSFIFGFQIYLNPGNFPDIATLIIQQSIVAALGIVVRLLYTWLLVGRYGATWGKMIVGIKIVTPDGQSITYMRAFGRFWAELISQLACYVGYIIAAFDDERRTLHDRMCNTRVVYK